MKERAGGRSAFTKVSRESDSLRSGIFGKTLSPQRREVTKSTVIP